jgi:hypothetical protein
MTTSEDPLQCHSPFGHDFLAARTCGAKAPPHLPFRSALSLR